MKILHVTFRYGQDTYGGAELHMRKLSEGLLKKGVSVDVCTTRTRGLSPLIKSGTLWDNRQDNENINGINVYRFPVSNPNKYVAMLFEKILQKRLDHEEDLEEDAIINNTKASFDEKGAVLLGGWNNLERYGASAMRWTRRKASFIIRDRGIREVSVTLSNPKKITGKLELKADGFEKTVPIPGSAGPQTLTVEVPGLSGMLLASIKLDGTWSLLKDHRTLGVQVSDISYGTGGRVHADMEYDYRKFFAKRGIYANQLFNKASARPMLYCGLFDYLRGPNSPAMVSWLKKHASEYDIIMAQMFPFNTIKYSVHAISNRPLVLMPLMHVDDEFYHWPHYYGYLRKADCILANSGYSKARVFDRIGGKSIIAGVGIDPDVYLNDRVNGNDFIKKYGLDNKNIILTVSRKSLSKRYDMLIKAMDIVKKSNRSAHLVMIGPDEDKVPINGDHVTYLGKVADHDLVNAYDACDVFAMMSESESFGMVFCEAWSRKKPVIGNSYCGAVASQIEDGVDGYACDGVEDIADKINLLMGDEALRARLGTKGFDKVVNNYTWDKVAQKVYEQYEILIAEGSRDEHQAL